jgi:hypothetical protein
MDCSTCREVSSEQPESRRRCSKIQIEIKRCRVNQFRGRRITVMVNPELR